MFKVLSLTLLLPLCSQAQEKVGAELEHIQRAATAFCAHDTLQTIDLIESYIAQYGGSESDLGPYKTLGHIYYAFGDAVNAVRVWKFGLGSGKSNYFDSFIQKCGMV